MKVEIKRKLSRKARADMSAGGRKGTTKQKREAGKLGWQAMVKSISRTSGQ